MFNTEYPFIIAELSANHDGKIENALKLIEEAKSAGAHAIKLQTFTADTITLNHDGPGFIIKDGLWKSKKLYDLYREAHTPWEWHAELFNKGKELGIIVFSTPFDKTSVDFLEKLNSPLYKVASNEIIDLPLIRYIAQTNKPMIISTGMASIDEIDMAVQAAKENGCKDLTMLHCISAYPTPVENSNLAMMLDLKNRYPEIRIGLSDHSLGTVVAITAIALGARVIEKHFTLTRSSGGIDSAFSLEPHELKILCDNALMAFRSIGVIDYNRSQDEKNSAIYRRSLYIAKEIQKGEVFTLENIRSVRPGYGLPPKEIDKILGKRAAKLCQFGQPLMIEMVENE